MLQLLSVLLLATSHCQNSQRLTARFGVQVQFPWQLLILGLYPAPRVPDCDNRLSYIGRTLAVVDGMKKTYTGTRTCRRTETNTVCPVGQYLDISSFRREKLLANRKEAVSWEWFLWESRGTWTSEKLLIDRWFWLVFDVKAMIIFHPILRNY